MDVEKYFSKLPDLYFDWYARFLPGATAVFAFFYISENEFPVSIPGLILWAFLSYLAGHLVQPIVGSAVKFCEKIIREIEVKVKSESYKVDVEEIFKDVKRKRVNDSLILKASKAHAEANSSFATALLISLVALITTNTSWVLIIVFLFILSGINRVFARRRKILDLVTDEELGNYKIYQNSN